MFLYGMIQWEADKGVLCEHVGGKGVYHSTNLLTPRPHHYMYPGFLTYYLCANVETGNKARNDLTYLYLLLLSGASLSEVWLQGALSYTLQTIPEERFHQLRLLR